ncbi:hypothetical protein HDV00_006840 [Rhizophlyctis rosea]|nr:hypothetical protein HDV00_006840 [Rhizophlyctis rosea]
MVNHLLEYGADINTVEGEILNLAIKSGNILIVETLVDGGADKNLESREGLPIDIAAKFGFTDLARLLLEKGADPNAGQNWGFSEALCYAASAGNLEICQILLEGGVDIPYSGPEALLGAIDSGHVGIVKLLLENGRDIHEDFIDHLTKAVLADNLEIVTLLLDVEVRISREAVSAAAAQGNADILRVLMQNAPGKEDWHTFKAYTSGLDMGLMAAAENGHYHIVKMLVEAGGARYQLIYQAMKEVWN